MTREKEDIIWLCQLITRISHVTYGSEAYPITEEDEKTMKEIALVCDSHPDPIVPLPVAGAGGAPPAGLRAEPGPSADPPIDHAGAETAFGLGSSRYPLLCYEAFFSGERWSGMNDPRYKWTDDCVYQWQGDGGSRGSVS